VSSTAPASSITVGVDGSDESRAALSWAAMESVRRHRPLHLLHSYEVLTPYAGGGVYTSLTSLETDRVESAAHHVLDDGVTTVARLAPGVAVTASLHRGSAARALVEASTTADTVVVGARGRGSLTAAVLGSVSAQVAMHAHAPVVVIKNREGSTAPGDRVVVGLDGSAGSQACLAYAFEQADSRGTTLDAVLALPAELAGWVPDPSQDSTDAMTRGELLLSEALAGWAPKYPGVQVRRSIMFDDPVSALSRSSDGAQLLVVGSRGHGGFAGLVLGSVSHGVLQEADCPVAVVRGSQQR
jgi:nucleotide-binding universal stress UspA family protein